MISTITIPFKGQILDIEYSFQPDEESIRGHVEEISAITIEGACFLEMLEDYTEELKDIISNELKK